MIRHLKKAIKKDKQYKEALSSLAKLYFETKQYEKAREVNNKYLKIKPDSEKAKKLHVTFRLTRGKYGT